MTESGEILFDQFADLSALEGQLARIKAIYAEAKKGIIDLNNAGNQISGAKGFGALNEGLKKRKKAQDELSLATEAYNKILSDNAKLEAKLAAMQSDAARKNAVLKEQAIAIAKARKEEAKEANGSVDAYAKLAKQYEEAARKAQNLIVTKGKDAQETKDAIALAQKLGAQLKDTDAQVLKFQRNVGNYAQSLSGGFETVRREIARLQREKANFEIGGDTRSAQAASVRIKELDDIIRVSFDDTKNFDQVVKSLQKSYSNLATSGNQSNEFLQEFKKFVAESKDQAEDLKTEIKALSSDTRRLDLAAGAVSFLADSFQLAAGAAQLAGVSEEDAAEATAKLVAITSVANGLKGIANELTTKGTAANKAFAFVQNLVALSMDRTAAASVRLKASLGIIGISVTVIGAIAIAYSLLTQRQSEAALKQKALNDVLKEAGSEYAKAVENVNALRQNIELAKNGFISKKDVVKQYNDTIGKTTGEVKNLDEAEKALAKNADAYIKFTLLKAAAQVAFAKAAEEAVKIEISRFNESDLSKTDRRRAAFSNATKEEIKAYNEIRKQANDAFFAGDKKRADELNAKADSIYSSRVESGFEIDAKKIMQKYLDLGKSFSAESAKISKQMNFDFFGGFNSESKKASDDPRSAILEAKNKALELEISYQRQILEIDTFTYEERMKALRNYLRLKNEQIDNDFRAKLADKGLSDDEIADIEKTLKAEGQIIKKYSKITNEELKAAAAERTLQMNAVSEEAVKTFSKNAKDVVAAAVDSMNDLPDEAKAIFDKMEYELGEGVKLLLGELTDAQKEALSKLDIQEQQAKMLLEIKDAYQDTFETIASTTNDIIGAIFDKQTERIQRQIEEIDRLKNAEIERATQQKINADGTVVTEEQRAARIKIIEAKAQADKEKLEAKKRQLERQKAIAQKAFTIFQVTSDGLQAVNKARLEAQFARMRATVNPIFAPAAALAQGILFQTIVSAAAGVVSAAAAPLPKFFRGKNVNGGDDYEGPGWVADAGREIKVSSDGSATLYSHPTVTDIKKDDIIYPNYMTEWILRNIAKPTPYTMGMMPVGNGPVLLPISNPEEVELLRIIAKESKNKIQIYNHPAVETTADYIYHLKR